MPTLLSLSRLLQDEDQTCGKREKFIQEACP
jgi:hypothetical protein